jgi:hypothetical protein
MVQRPVNSQKPRSSARRFHGNMAGNKQAPEFGTFYAWMNGCGEYGCPLSSKPCLEEVDIMSCKQQESREASETIDTCIEELTELIATFRMYGGRLVDIDRGDFDIDFFKGLHTKCSNIYNKLQDVSRLLPQGSQKARRMAERYLNAPDAVRIRTIT